LGFTLGYIEVEFSKPSWSSAIQGGVLLSHRTGLIGDWRIY